MGARVIVAALCGLCAAAVGLVVAGRMKKRSAGLQAAYEMVNMLMEQVCSLERPLPEGIKAVARANGLAGAIIQAGPPLQQASWEQAGRQFFLRREDIGILTQLLAAIPRGARGESRHFESALLALQAAFKKAEAKYEKDGALYKKLGFLLGAAVFILLF